MGFDVRQRNSDISLIETVMHGHTVGSGSVIRPAETHWHMVFVRENGNQHTIITGPLTSSGVVPFSEGAEILWIKFKLGAWLSHLPIRECVDGQTQLPQAAGRSFWLKGSAWQIPDFENVDTFVGRLIRQEMLTLDPVVESVLQGHSPNVAERTIRHRFQHSTGLSPKQIEQIGRAQHAAALLQTGVSILDTVHEAGYYDQPHLTRALRQWIGFTPLQIQEAQFATLEGTDSKEKLIDR